MAWLAAGLGIVLLLTSCSGLSSEPAIISTAPLPTVTATVPPDIGHPIAPISLAAGAAIFNGAQGCQACHGTSGAGNGVTAANFTCKIPNATDPTVARSATISDWFAVTTNGNGGDVSCLMPPWQARLTEKQRWDAASYLYSLHYTPDVISTGAKIWAANCVQCHGEHGAGDGPKAKDSARPVPDFTDPAYLITHSDSDLYNSISKGIGAIMPAFADKLDENARWAAVAYLRTLSWGGASILSATTPTVAPTATIPPIPDTPTITVSGKLSNGTPGGKIPDNLPLTLQILDQSSGSIKQTAKIDGTAIGESFTFKDVPRQIGQSYVITTQYAGVQQFTTPIALVAGAGTSIDLPLTLYETSGDPSHIQIQIQQIIIDFPSSSNALIEEGLNITNMGKTIFVSDQKTSVGNPISLQVPLPSGSQHVALDPNVQNQFVVTGATSPIIQGITPLPPGEARPLQFSFSLPFDRMLDFSQPSPYSVAALNIYVPAPSGFAMSDPHYKTTTPITLKDTNNQDIQYNAYTLANAPSVAGGAIHIVVAPGASLQADDATSRRNTLGVVLTLALIVFAGIGLAVWRLNRLDRGNRRPTARANTIAEALTQQIAALDDHFEAGEIPQSEYEAQRSQLKADLIKLLNGAKTA